VTPSSFPGSWALTNANCPNGAFVLVKKIINKANPRKIAALRLINSDLIIVFLVFSLKTT
jgi:hypothetical protein